MSEQERIPSNRCQLCGDPKKTTVEGIEVCDKPGCAEAARIRYGNTATGKKP